MTGTITAQYPIQITIASAKISNLFTAAGQVYFANNTTSATLSGVSLLPQNGYAITIKNEGGQNNTVTMSLQLDDVPGGGSGGM
jgi:hypothetical protein